MPKRAPHDRRHLMETAWFPVPSDRESDSRPRRVLSARDLRYQDNRLLRYSRGRFTYLTPLEHQELLLTLSEAVRRRVLARTRKLRERQLTVRLPTRPGV